MLEYRPRLIDSELDKSLEAFGAVLVAGPKWCGKTTTASRVAKSILRMQDPDTRDMNLARARVRPSELLEGENPRLIDEWQVAPRLWDAVRLSVDLRGEPGLYILTGSTVADESEIGHSGTGRIEKIKMGTMSLFESGDSTGSVSLRGLFDGESRISGESRIRLEELAMLLARGGWPQSIGKSEAVCRRLVKGYCESIIEVDIPGADGRRRDPRKMRGLMRSLSRRISSPMSKAGIIADMSSEATRVAENTLSDYLAALRKIYVLDEMPAWNPSLRSKSAMRVADTVHLCDPAIAAYFLGASKADLMRDLNTFGLLFESMAIRDLRAYAASAEGDVFHYRDGSGLEADAVIHLHDGRWGAFEVKLDGDVEKGAKTLLKLREAVDSERMGGPSFIAVIVGTGHAYTREDGVHVIPLGCLGP